MRHVKQLAEILPREVEGIIACCTPVPTLLRQQVQEVHRLIQTARNSTAVKRLLIIHYHSPLLGYGAEY